MNNLLGGDFRFFWPENIGYFVGMPSAWDSSLNTGIGIPQLNTLWITSYLNLTSSFSVLGLSWPTISFIFWLLPIIIISFFSTIFFYKILIGKSNLYSFIAGLIYCTNTYFLLVFFGGQVGVAFGYAFIPLVFLRFIILFKNAGYYSSVFAGFVLALQVLFDPRITALTISSLFLYYILQFKFGKKDLTYFVLIPFGIVLLIHSYWILPLIFYKSNIVPQGFNSISGIKFLSFAFLENTVSLLHPNWPDNIFGKVSFMKPEFIVLPILAYSSLLLLNVKLKFKKEEINVRHLIVFFALLSLIAAFFAKGGNDPFGVFFIWLVDKIPGFSMFRDATKFYALIALAYSILIPYSLHKISGLLNNKLQQKVLPILFLVFWIFSLRLAFSSSAVFKPIHQVPISYIQLKDFLNSQNQFFRTLWIPSWQRYGYFSNNHPAIGRGELFKEASASGMIKELKQEKTISSLKELGVKYVIIPEDSEGELFLKNRKYDEKTYRRVVSDAEQLNDLSRVKVFGKIVVFEISNSFDRFWSPSKQISLSYKMIKPTQYNIFVKNVRKGDIIVFSEGYNKYWIAYNSDFKVKSVEFHNNLNSFVLPKDGSYNFEIYYQPQVLVNLGLIISGLAFFGVIFILIKKYKKNK